MTARRALVTLVAGAVVALALVAVPAGGAQASSPLAAPVASPSCPPAPAAVLNAAPSVAGSAKTVALTFDDGPGRSTQAIIDILRSFHVRATFFNIGWDIRDYPSLVKEEAADGFLLGDHTNSHPDMMELSRAAQTSEVVQVMDLQRQLTGTVPCVFRPPYGDYNATTRSIVKSHGMSLWMWSVGGDDWQADGSDSAYWVRRIESSVIMGARGQSHPVVLLHNQMIAMPATVAALPTIIRSFERRGYTFVDLLGRTGPPGVCGDPAAATPTAAYASLASGATLVSGASVDSPGGQFVLTMNPDGQLTYSEVGGRTLWSTPTSDSPGAEARVAGGALTITAADGQTIWSTGTSAATVVLHLDANGDLELVAGTQRLWSSGTLLTTMGSGAYMEPGWYVSSPNDRCQLTMTATGSLRLVAADHQRLWWNDVTAPGGRTVLQESGSLVTTTASGSVTWSSATSRYRNDVVEVTDSGTLRLVTAHGAVVWATQ